MAGFEAIHERAKFEPISEAEIAQIVRELEHPEQGADPYMLIQTLGGPARPSTSSSSSGTS